MTTATPQVLPKDLNDELLTLYTRALQNGRTLQQKDAPAPGEFDDCEKLAALGLGSASVRDTDYPTLWVTRLHKLFTTVHCGDPNYGFYVSIHVPSAGPYTRNNRPDSWPLLATAFGAQLELGDTRNRVIVRHTSATDFEHDSAHLLTLDLDGPIELSGYHYAPTIGFMGRISLFRAWPYGTKLEDMGDDESNGECDGKMNTAYGYSADHDPHLFTAYTPNDDAYNTQCDALIDRKVYFKLTPAALVDNIGELKSTDE